MFLKQEDQCCPSVIHISLIPLPDTNTVDQILLLVNDDDVIQLDHHHIFDKKGKSSITPTFLLS